MAKLVSKAGVIYFRDEETGQDVIAATADEATWLSFFLQQHLTSETVIQLRLAARHATAALNDGSMEAKDFPLKRN